MARNYKTNIEIVQDIIENSEFGVLAQAFVLEAIREKADEVAAGKVPCPENIGIKSSAWVGVAKEILDKLNSHFGD